MVTQSMPNSITLGGVEVPYTFCYLPQMELNFYPENPRIFSLVYTEDHVLSQSEIQQILQDKDYVKELAQSIKANNGLTDPLWVRDGDYLVIEGNSRLAAYRLLSKWDPVRWGKVKCNVFPQDIGDDKIFSFLCMTHVINRKDWAPYEQAGIIWRRWKQYNVTPEALAKEMGLPVSRITHYMKVYSFMDEHDDKAVQHWSFYDEYLKSRKIEKRRKDYSELDSIVVKQIQSGGIPKAEDIRDQLTKIAGSPGKALQRYLKEEKSLQECFDLMSTKGDDNALYKSLFRFRIKIGDLSTKKSLRSMDSTVSKKCKFELKKIKHSVDKLLKSF